MPSQEEMLNVLLNLVVPGAGIHPKMPRGPGVTYPPGYEPGQPQPPGTPRPGPGMGPPIVGAEAPRPEIVPGFGPGGLPQPLPPPGGRVVPMPQPGPGMNESRGTIRTPIAPQQPGFPQMPKNPFEEGGSGKSMVEESGVKSPVEEGGSGKNPAIEGGMGGPRNPVPGIGPQFSPPGQRGWLAPGAQAPAPPPLPGPFPPPGHPSWNNPNPGPPPSDEEKAILALQAQIEASKRMQQGR